MGGEHEVGGVTIGPVAVIENRGNDAAVGVVPAGEGGAVAVVECVLKDGVVLVEGLPLAGYVIVHGELDGGGGLHLVVGLASEEAGEDDFGVDVEGLSLGEGGGGGGEGVEGGKLEAGEAMLEGLLVGELVEDDPDDAVRLDGGCGGLM